MQVPQITFTRFIAAIAVVIFHFGKGIYPFNNGLLALLANNANVAVSYFFVLSGFVMIIAYGGANRKINAYQYYVNRIAKIYPVYVLALLLTLISATSVVYYKLFAELFLIQAGVPSFLPSYNLPAWSLSVELFFYLLFPLLYNRFYLNKRLRYIAIAVICFWLVSQIASCAFLSHLPNASDVYKNFVFYNPLVHLNEFVVGNLTGLVYFYIQKNNFFKGQYVLLVAGLSCSCLFIALLGLLPTTNLKQVLNLHNGLLNVVFAPCILFIALNKGRISKVLSLPLLVRLGEASYCIYIFQFPVFWLVKELNLLNDVVWLFYVQVVALIMFSFFIYFLLEIPAKNYLKRYLAK